MKLKYLNLIYLSVPFLSSLISTIHLVDFFSIGNEFTLAILLSITFEVGSIVSFIIPLVYNNISKNRAYFIFVILFLIQIIGNTFYSYKYMLMNKLEYVNLFSKFISNLFFFTNDVNFISFVLSIMIGVPIPLISLIFIKTWLEHLSSNNNEGKTNIVNKTNKIDKEQHETESDFMNNSTSIDNSVFTDNHNINVKNKNVEGMIDKGNNPNFENFRSLNLDKNVNVIGNI